MDGFDLIYVFRGIMRVQILNNGHNGELLDLI